MTFPESGTFGIRSQSRQLRVISARVALSSKTGGRLKSDMLPQKIDIFQLLRNLGSSGALLLGNKYLHWSNPNCVPHYKFGAGGHSDFLFFPPEAIGTTISLSLSRQFPQSALDFNGACLNWKLLRICIRQRSFSANRLKYWAWRWRVLPGFAALWRRSRAPSASVRLARRRRSEPFHHDLRAHHLARFVPQNSKDRFYF